MPAKEKNKTPPEADLRYEIEHKTMFISGTMTVTLVDQYRRQWLKELRAFPRNELKLNIDNLIKLDSAGVVFLQTIVRELKRRKIEASIETANPELSSILQTFSRPESHPREAKKKAGFFERIGNSVYSFFQGAVRHYIYLIADIFVWTISDVFHRKEHRAGEFINQAVLIGVNAVPIVALISLLIGLVLALQSAAQLRQFGANVFIADLTVIAMTREMGPLLTAIMIAGRSGSAIASEIATMRVTEEIDALKTMALNPVRYIVIPKMHASIVTLPFLTILADIFGIIGGMVVAQAYLDISPQVFYNRMADVLYLKDLGTGVFKSLVFSGIIVQTGAFFGFSVSGGAEGVGKVTTSAVVTSIFLVILADSIIGLTFY